MKKVKLELTPWESELLHKAYLFLDKDMTYEQEDEITQKLGASITDLVELKAKLQNFYK